MATEPDAELLGRFVHGEREAFESLFRQFEGDVYLWIVRIVRERASAEDALVETFWRAYRSRAHFDPSRSFGAWLRRIATNAALDQLRARRREAAMPLREHVAGRATDEHGAREAIAIAFGRLPPKLRIVATLALIEQLPQSEIAEAVGVPIGTVKSRLHRATRALKDHLTEFGLTP